MKYAQDNTPYKTQRDKLMYAKNAQNVAVSIVTLSIVEICG